MAGDGTIVRRISREDWTTMAWKNGGGITHELLRVGDGEGWSFRLSMAEVRENGPFSRFPGIERVIMLIEGEGFVLTREDGRVVRVDHPAVPFAFSGEEGWFCSLIGGPVLDFNVMFARAGGAVRVEYAGVGWVETRYFLCLEDGRVEGEQVKRLELLELAGSVWSEVKGIEIMSPQAT